MNNVSQVVESNLQAWAALAVALNYEASDLNKYYFASDASSLVGAAATNSTAVTVSSGLSKGQFVGGMTFVGALANFFTNQAVTQSDYLSSVENLIGGSNVAGSALSNDVEAIGWRLKLLGQNTIAMYKQASQILDLWNSSQLSSAAGAMSSTTVVPGCSTAVSKFDGGVGLIQQFINMVGNQAVASGYWGQTASQWTQGS